MSDILLESINSIFDNKIFSGAQDMINRSSLYIKVHKRSLSQLPEEESEADKELMSKNITENSDKLETKKENVVKSDSRYQPTPSGPYQETCECKKFIKPKAEQLVHLEKLDEIDPISNMTVRETIYKRHPNLGPQIFSTGPKCDLIPSVTRYDFKLILGLFEMTELSSYI